MGRPTSQGLLKTRNDLKPVWTQGAKISQHGAKANLLQEVAEAACVSPLFLLYNPKAEFKLCYQCPLLTQMFHL